jgi:hypothetical protein
MILSPWTAGKDKCSVACTSSAGGHSRIGPQPSAENLCTRAEPRVSKTTSAQKILLRPCSRQIYEFRVYIAVSADGVDRES